MVADEVRWLGGKARELLAAYDRLRPQHTLRTFSDVEELWETMVRPRVPEFQSMQEQGMEGREPPAPGSVWYANWRVPEAP